MTAMNVLGSTFRRERERVQKPGLLGVIAGCCLGAAA